MVDQYQHGILQVLDSPDAVVQLAECRGIGHKTAEKIKDSWEQSRMMRDGAAALEQQGLPPKQARQLLQKFGQQAQQLVSDDPYTAILDIEGGSFRLAEQVAARVGASPDLPSRAGAAMLHVLQAAAAQNGHSHLPWGQLCSQTLRILTASGRPWSRASSWAHATEELVGRRKLVVEHACPTASGLQPVFQDLAAQTPVEVAGGKEQRVKRWIDSHHKITGEKLSGGQLEAVMRACNAPVMVLTGGPGCGKTFATRTIVKLWRAMKKKVKLCAPTGRAAQRLEQICGVRATTIHRLLAYKGRARAQADESSSDIDPLDLTAAKGGVFEHDGSHPLDVDAVLVDEASMLDLPLTAALLAAIPRDRPCQLLLVGDADQLPSIGAGGVLEAAIQAGVIPVVDLRDIFRQARQSSIVTSAHAINAGQFPHMPLLPASHLQGDSPAGLQQGDALWVKVAEGTSASVLEDLLLQTLQHYLPHTRFNIHTDVQVLSPMRKGLAGTHSLNIRLQALLNPRLPGKLELVQPSHGVTLRQGDRVVQCINCYDKEVFNGDVGVITFVDPAQRTLTVQFAPLADSADRKPHEVEYRGRAIQELELAWATTVHKAQGGESQVVVLVLSASHRPMLQRRLLYTAVTRAKDLLIVVSSQGAIQMAVQQAESSARLSSLMERLQLTATSMGVNTQQHITFGSHPGTEAAPSEAVPAIVGRVLPLPVWLSDMSLFHETDLQFTPEEIEFFAQDDIVTIVPNFSLPVAANNTLNCIWSNYGPFQPNIHVSVPLWLALTLHKRNKCRIEPPDWLEVGRLEEVLELERSTAQVFQPLPFHYIETSRLLLENARDTFGENAYQVRDLVESIRKLRFTKIDAGLAILQGPMTVKLNNLSAMECALIRPFFQGALDRYWKLHKAEQPRDMGTLQPLGPSQEAVQSGSNAGLVQLIKSLKRQHSVRWEAVLLVMDSKPFEDLQYILQDLKDERVWVFAEWIGVQFSPRVDNQWAQGYHALLYNLTDEAVRACPTDTKWVVITNGDNEYADTFFDELASARDADVVAFDYYSRYQRSTGVPCERFGGGPGTPPCKPNKLIWCHTDLGANVFNWPRLIAEDRRFGSLEADSGGLTADHFDGIMAQSLLNAGWRVHHVAGLCLYDHSPTPQRCARTGGVWDDSEAATYLAVGGQCLSREQADERMRAGQGRLEEVTVQLSTDGALEAFNAARTPVEPVIRCLRQADVAAQQQAFREFFGPFCTSDLDASGFQALLLNSEAHAEQAQRSAGVSQVFAHQRVAPAANVSPPKPPPRNANYTPSIRRRVPKRWQGKPPGLD
ncbi:hypothetical protein WJX72_005917 [[Myrmecia] bisecta]|uniref:Uncharacterized protein n=1 Tax=[Myrmecia] bisecta TaxID=41462 RepID=A0AAW1PP76_9CHLO